MCESTNDPELKSILRKIQACISEPLGSLDATDRAAPSTLWQISGPRPTHARSDLTEQLFGADDPAAQLRIRLRHALEEPAPAPNILPSKQERWRPPPGDDGMDCGHVPRGTIRSR